MRCLTYNILKGAMEGEWGDRTSLVQTVVREARPDLVVLNECNGFEREARCAAFERAWGMRAQLAPATSGFHVCLMHSPELPVTHLPLALSGFMHAAVAAVVEWEPQPFVLLGTHLDPFDADHRSLELAQLLAQARAHRPDLPLLIMGDLNALSPHDVTSDTGRDWSPRYRERHHGSGGFPDTRALALLEAEGLQDLALALGRARDTRPTRMYGKPDVPRQRLDHIFASPELAAWARGIEVLDGPIAQAASDHLPVLARFQRTRIVLT